MGEYFFPTPSFQYFVRQADLAESRLLARLRSRKTDEAIRLGTQMNRWLVRAFGADQPLSSFCRETVARMYRLGRIDLMGEWMQRTIWTRDRDFRFIHAWLSNVNPHIAAEAVTALGRSMDPALVPVFSRMLTGSESLPMRLRIIKALGELGMPGQDGLALDALDARLENKNFLPFAEEMAIIKSLGLIGTGLQVKTAGLPDQILAPQAIRIEAILAQRWDSSSTRQISGEELFLLQTNLIDALARAGKGETLRVFTNILDRDPGSKLAAALAHSVGRADIEVARSLIPRLLRQGLHERDEADLITGLAESLVRSDGRERLLPKDWLVTRLQRENVRNQILRLLSGYAWPDVRRDFLGLLDGKTKLGLKDAAVIVQVLETEREMAAAPLLVALIRANPEDQLVPLWMQALAALKAPQTREVLVELSKNGLKGIRILAEQILQTWP